MRRAGFDHYSHKYPTKITRLALCACARKKMLSKLLLCFAVSAVLHFTCSFGQTCNPSACCSSSQTCCLNGCCRSSFPVCCSQYASCCPSNFPTCCPNRRCCPANSPCCSNGCCPAAYPSAVAPTAVPGAHTAVGVDAAASFGADRQGKFQEMKRSL